MENNKNFSEGFLNKLLESAIEYYNINVDNNSIKNKHSDVITAINSYKNALKFEAHKSMQKEILKDSDPILHAINLNSTPGIISGKTKDKYTVHKKYKIKKEKTAEQIEKEIIRAKERLEKRELLKLEKDKEKQIIKDKRTEIKDDKATLKQIEKNTNKSKLDSDTQKHLYEEYKNEYNKMSSPKEKDTKKLKMLEQKTNEYDSNYKAMIAMKEDKTNELKNKETSFNNILEEKKLLKKQKAEERKQKAEERKQKAEEIKQKAEEKKALKEQKIAKQKDMEHANDMNLYDELFDLMIEASKLPKDDSDNITSSSVSLDNIKLHESPLPYYRHIKSLDESCPNKLLLPALLNGNTISGDAFIKIYHGPPGTGKTYTIMQELKKIMYDPTHYKILVCAPSNIAVLNMYERAKELKLDCSIVVSSKNMPKNAEEENDLLNDKIIFSTISMRFGSKLRNVKFSTVFMDEAAQCMEAWTWGLLRPELKYIYMAGDQHQLPALVSEEGTELKHNISMMERLMSLNYPSELLSVQRRMNPKIVDFPNTQYYNGKLKTDYKPLSGNNETPFEIIHLDSKEERVGTSYINKLEAAKCIELYKKYTEMKNTSSNKLFKKIIIISPYKAQCNYLKKLDSKLEIHTVDSFQGHEADVVILTTVRTENIGFWADYRRLNVAMTRAKHVLRIFGNTKCWLHGPLNDLIKFYKKN